MEGRPLLFFPLVEGRCELARYLVSRGADVSAVWPVSFSLCFTLLPRFSSLSLVLRISLLLHHHLLSFSSFSAHWQLVAQARNDHVPLPLSSVFTSHPRSARYNRREGTQLWILFCVPLVPLCHCRPSLRLQLLEPGIVCPELPSLLSQREDVLDYILSNDPTDSFWPRVAQIDGQQFLYSAASVSYPPVIRTVLRHRPQWLQQADDEGQTPLMAASVLPRSLVSFLSVLREFYPRTEDFISALDPSMLTKKMFLWRSSVLEILLEAGVPANLGYPRYCPLEVSIRSYGINYAATQLLLRAGAGIGISLSPELNIISPAIDDAIMMGSNLGPHESFFSHCILTVQVRHLSFNVIFGYC